MKAIAVYGAGGLGRELALLIAQINNHQPQWQFIGFFDDGMEAGRMIDGFPLLGGIKELNGYAEELYLVMGIGNPQTKKKIVNGIINEHIFFAVLVHPAVVISEEILSVIGEGSVITAGNILTVNIHIGNHVLLNLSGTVGHDAVIGDYASIMPGVNISGEVMVREGVYIGTGATVLNKVEIGAYTIIGAGAVVTKSLPGYCTAVGMPARPIKYHHPIQQS